MFIHPNCFKHIWYENEKGDKWFPPDDTQNTELMDDLSSALNSPKELVDAQLPSTRIGDVDVPIIGALVDPTPPEGFIYFHSRFPMQLHESVLYMVQRAEVDACLHPPEHVRPTGGWIEGIEGRECTLCYGTQVKPVTELWPEQWDAYGSRQLFTSTSGWDESLVLALVHSHGYTLSQAIIIAAMACERCMNALAHHCGLPWGYPEFSESWQKCDTSCAFCKSD